MRTRNTEDESRWFLFLIYKAGFNSIQTRRTERTQRIYAIYESPKLHTQRSDVIIG